MRLLPVDPSSMLEVPDEGTESGENETRSDADGGIESPTASLSPWMRSQQRVDLVDNDKILTVSENRFSVSGRFRARAARLLDANTGMGATN